jgi:sulfur carrier protein ThiS
MPRVTARISATLAAGGPTRRPLDMPDPATVAGAIAALEADLGMTPGSLGSAAVSVAGAIVGHDHPLLGGEELAVVVPVAGG